MNDITDALKEAYKGNATDVIIHTLELNSTPPLRIVSNYEDWVAMLENGEEVTFTAHNFICKLPDLNHGFPTLEITIDNINREFSNALELAIKTPENPLNIIYRPYLSSDPSQIQMNPAIKMSIIECNLTIDNFTALAQLPIQLNKTRFPVDKYNPEQFPLL